jgi:hypothetical protein
MGDNAMTDASLLSRGRVAGSILVLLGAWGAIIPFVGPYFGYAYTPDKVWVYTSGRLWLSVLPGAAAFLGGLLIIVSERAGVAGALLAALGGAWFIIGQPVTALAKTGGSISAGSPVISSGAAFGAATMRFLEGLGFFYGVGILIIFFAALALGQIALALLMFSRDDADATELTPYENQLG